MEMILTRMWREMKRTNNIVRGGSYFCNERIASEERRLGGAEDDGNEGKGENGSKRTRVVVRKEGRNAGGNRGKHREAVKGVSLIPVASDSVVVCGWVVVSAEAGGPNNFNCISHGLTFSTEDTMACLLSYTLQKHSCLWPPWPTYAFPPTQTSPVSASALLPTFKTSYASRPSSLTSGMEESLSMK